MKGVGDVALSEIKRFKAKQASPEGFPENPVPSAASGSAPSTVPVPVAGEYWPYFPELDGQIVIARGFKTEAVDVKRYGGQWKLFVHMEMADDQWPETLGELIYMSMNLPMSKKTGKRKRHPTSHPGSKFYENYSIANEGRPRWGEDMPYKRFLSTFEVRLHSVVMNDKQKKKHRVNRYTVAEEIIDLVERGPKSF